MGYVTGTRMVEIVDRRFISEGCASNWMQAFAMPVKLVDTVGNPHDRY